MAIITTASCTVLSCGTCGAQILVGHSIDNGLGRDPAWKGHQRDERVGTWLDLHERGCPDRELALPRVLPEDRGSPVVA